MQIENFRDFVAVAKRRKKRAILVFLALAIITLATVFLWPSVYRSSATILIEQQEIPNDLVRSTITSYADQRLQIISQRVMTRTNLMGVIEKYSLYPDDIKDEPIEVIIEEMHEAIKMETISADVIDPRSGQPTSATIAFSLSFDYEDPSVAEKVANELTSLYLNENMKNRRETTIEASDFLDAEAEKTSTTIEGIENRLAAFKQANVNLLPEMKETNVQIIDRTQRDLADVERQLRSLSDRKISLSASIEQVSPNTTLYAESGARIPSKIDRLKELETTIISMTSMYSAAHPELKRMKKEYEALRSELVEGGESTQALDLRADLQRKLQKLSHELTSTKQKYSVTHPDVVRLESEVRATRAMLLDNREAEKLATTPDNPAYLQLQAQLDSVDADIESLRKTHSDLEKSLADYQQRILHSPGVEKEYKMLMRDYENAWNQYRTLKGKQMDAQLALTLESERKGEKFTLIEPPVKAEKPIKPNRIAILVIGLLLALGGGFGVAILLEKIDDAIYDRRSIVMLLKTEPLISIPCIITLADYKRKRRQTIIVSTSVVVVSTLLVTLIHWVVIPLDVLWYAGLRKLDI